MTLGPEYEDQGKTWRDVRLWSPGDEMPKGYQYARKPGEWQNGRADPGSDIMVGVPYRVPVEKPGPTWSDVRLAASDCAAVVGFGESDYRGIRFRTPELALKAMQAAEAPQTAPEAPAPVPPALPMTLVPTSPEPPCGSVVLVGRYPQAYQRFDRGWCPTGGTVAHSWHRLTRDNDPVILIYVPPEPAL